MGFQICINDTKITILTDTGKITREHITSMRESQLVLLETNHDIPLLWRSTRPPWLKRRIRSNHLANEESNSVLSSLVDSDIKGMFLGHLSGECNSPELVAYELTQLEIPVKWEWFICRRTRMGTRVEHNGEQLSYVENSESLETLAEKYNPRTMQKALPDYFPSEK
jgi:hypothetical protein